MRPTRLRVLLAVALVVGAVAWAVVLVAEDRGRVLPALPWQGPASVGALALVVLATAVAVRPRLHGRGQPVRPLGAARLAALGKAASHVGAVLAGGYGGYAAVLLADLGVGDRRGRGLLCLAAVGAAAGLVAAGLWLERLFRLPPEEPGAGGDADGTAVPGPRRSA